MRRSGNQRHPPGARHFRGDFTIEDDCVIEHGI